MMANATTYNTKNYQPPGEWLQKLNALLHKEPFASLAYAVYWSFMLITVTPAATVFLHAQAAYRILAWLLGWTGQDEYLPSSFKNINNKDDGSSMPELGVVITGCDSGFGKELALWADHAGFHVFAGCLFEASFVAFDETNNITPILMDVTKDEHVNAAVKRVEKWIAAVADNGKKRALHALCNNAGIVKLTWIDWMEMKDIQLIMEVNYFGMVRCCKAFLPLLKKQAKEGTHEGASRILNIASVAGKVTVPGALTAYAASKHAAVAFSNGLQGDLANFGIQVCTICPTFHGTPMITDSVANINETGKKFPKEILEEYGEEFQEFNVHEALHAQSLSWRMDVVVEQLLNLLTVKSVPAEIYVGSDAKFVLAVTRMFPQWLLSFSQRYYPRPRPVPACMRRK